MIRALTGEKIAANATKGMIEHNQMRIERAKGAGALLPDTDTAVASHNGCPTPICRSLLSVPTDSSESKYRIETFSQRAGNRVKSGSRIASSAASTSACRNDLSGPDEAGVGESNRTDSSIQRRLRQIFIVQEQLALPAITMDGLVHGGMIPSKFLLIEGAARGISGNNARGASAARIQWFEKYLGVTKEAEIRVDLNGDR
jgi:hypothetical protein